jgi:hypothetical protein
MVLGLCYIPSKVREDTGEIELLLKNPGKDFEKIVDLVDYNDIKSDLRLNSNFDGGTIGLRIWLKKQKNWVTNISELPIIPNFYAWNTV